jgi:hypothetical protein
MLSKTTWVVFLSFAVFGSSGGTFPMDASAREGYRLRKEAVLACAWPQKQRVSLQPSAHKKLSQSSGKEEFEELREQLEALIEEMKKLEKEASEEFLKEILPRIKEEIEKLKEKLRKWRDEQGESEPIEVEATEI